MSYRDFLDAKRQKNTGHGFEPTYLPDHLFGFQRDLTAWAIRQGRGAIFADCGMGKTPMELVWADNVVRKTNGRVLFCAPLAVAFQVAREAEKFGVDVTVSRDGKIGDAGIYVTNYERLGLFSPADFVGMVV